MVGITAQIGAEPVLLGGASGAQAECGGCFFVRPYGACRHVVNACAVCVERPYPCSLHDASSDLSGIGGILRKRAVVGANKNKDVEKADHSKKSSISAQGKIQQSESSGSLW